MALASEATLAGDAAFDWLLRMQEAARTQSFIGTLMYRQNDNIDAIKIIRQVKDGHIREKVFSLTGSYREVVRNDGDVWCYLPEKSAAAKKINKAVNGFPDFLPEDLSVLNTHYEIKSGERKRQAGRICQKISIVPKDHYRYGYDLYADLETGLLLAADLVAPDDSIIESYMFSEITFDPDIRDKDLAPSNPEESIVWHHAKKDAATRKPASAAKAQEWQLLKPPGGFHLAGVAMINDGNQEHVKQLIYTDGLATISIFIKKIAQKKRQLIEKVKKIRQIGALNALGMESRGHEITVVGDVPPDALRLIEGSLDENDNAGVNP